MGTQKQLSIVDQDQQTAESLKSDAQKNTELGAYIVATLEIETNFKLFSYRIINEDVFKAKIKEVMESLKHI